MRKFSKETKAKMSESQKKRWALKKKNYGLSEIRSDFTSDNQKKVLNVIFDAAKTIYSLLRN